MPKIHLLVQNSFDKVQSIWIWENMFDHLPFSLLMIVKNNWIHSKIYWNCSKYYRTSRWIRHELKLMKTIVTEQLFNTKAPYISAEIKHFANTNLFCPVFFNLSVFFKILLRTEWILEMAQIRRIKTNLFTTCSTDQNPNVEFLNPQIFKNVGEKDS